MAKPKQKATKTKPKAPAVAVVDDDITGSQADYEANLPAAMVLSASEVVPLRADPSLALANIQVGVASVLAEVTRLEKLPETDVAAVRALEGVVLAVVFASTQVQTADPSGLAALFVTAYALRALLLKTADSLVEAGLLKKVDVDKIKAGYGRLDAAKDLIALSALFTKNAAAIRGKHPVSAAQIKQASALGTQLVALLKPGRAKKASASVAVGVNERDRMWTLVVQGYDALWRAGAYLFGKDLVDDKVPPLLSGKGGRPKKTTTTSTPTNGSTLTTEDKSVAK